MIQHRFEHSHRIQRAGLSGMTLHTVKHLVEILLGPGQVQGTHFAFEWVARVVLAPAPAQEPHLQPSSLAVSQTSFCGFQRVAAVLSFRLEEAIQT